MRSAGKNSTCAEFLVCFGASANVLCQATSVTHTVLTLCAHTEMPGTRGSRRALARMPLSLHRWCWYHQGAPHLCTSPQLFLWGGVLPQQRGILGMAPVTCGLDRRPLPGTCLPPLPRMGQLDLRTMHPRLENSGSSDSDLTPRGLLLLSGSGNVSNLEMLFFRKALTKHTAVYMRPLSARRTTCPPGGSGPCSLSRSSWTPTQGRGVCAPLNQASPTSLFCTGLFF